MGKFGSLRFLSLDRVRNTWKNYIFKLNTDSKYVNKNHNLDLDVPELDPHCEDEKRSYRSLINLKFFTR